MDSHEILIREIIKFLQDGGAHASLDDALSGLPAALRGKKPDNLPYSIWQLVEHIRIAQWDMLEFCKDANHKSLKWPEEYWPKETSPANDSAWENSITQINADLEEFIQLLNSANIYQKLPHGQGQSILREALQIGDHNAYHIAEIIMIRRLLGAWKN
jgi:hypothetical protein